MRSRPVLMMAFAIACGPEALPCAEPRAPDCDLLYAPTFDEIFRRRLRPTCADGERACHGPEGARAGLVFADPDEAYALLLGAGAASARVTPGDPSCSLLVRRLESGDPDAQMPPGEPLSGPELCTIQRWIAAGAPR